MDDRGLVAFEHATGAITPAEALQLLQFERQAREQAEARQARTAAKLEELRTVARPASPTTLVREMVESMVSRRGARRGLCAARVRDVDVCSCKVARGEKE